MKNHQLVDKTIAEMTDDDENEKVPMEQVLAHINGTARRQRVVAVATAATADRDDDADLKPDAEPVDPNAFSKEGKDAMTKMLLFGTKEGLKNPWDKVQTEDEEEIGFWENDIDRLYRAGEAAKTADLEAVLCTSCTSSCS